MDQFICASLSNTHYWYEVGMLTCHEVVIVFAVYVTNYQVHILTLSLMSGGCSEGRIRSVVFLSCTVLYLYYTVLYCITGGDLRNNHNEYRIKSAAAVVQNAAHLGGGTPVQL